MKQCSVFNKNMCLGCTGLGEKEWAGPERCSIYKKYNKTNGLDLCKKILKGESQCQMKI